MIQEEVESEMEMLQLYLREEEEVGATAIA